MPDLEKEPGPNYGRFILYGRLECELCDKAEMMIGQVAPALAPHVRKVDIDSDTGLRERYGLVIPVLRCAASGREMHWPFPPSRLREFLAQPIAE